MRLTIGTRFETRFYRLIWITESKSGCYIGLFGAEDMHLSYHADGTKHFRKGRSSPIEQHRSDPIDRLNDCRDILHTGIPITGAWFSERTEFRSDAKTVAVQLLDSRLFEGYDTLTVDVFLMHRDAEQTFLERVIALEKARPNHQLVLTDVFALDEFPAHKLGLLLSAARTIKPVSRPA